MVRLSAFGVLSVVLILLLPTLLDLFRWPSPRAESEPNNRLHDADWLGAMPVLWPAHVLGEICEASDLDVFEVLVMEPCFLDIRVVTGGLSIPASGHGGCSPGDPVYAPSFIPVLRFYGPSGRLIHVEVSTAPNLLMLDVPVPLAGQSFYVEVSALGGRGVYGLQVSV